MDRRSPSQRPIRWLHLSDFHFRGLEDWDSRATLDALLRHAGELMEKGQRPDFVFVTGDVAVAGQQKDYEQAELFFRRLAEVLELDPPRDFFFVPGNHDVDRGAVGFEQRMVDTIKSQDEIEELLGDAQLMTPLGRRLENFYYFTERLLGTARAWHADRPWRVDEREIDGLRVAVLQLNSAWASARDDELLLVGEAQVRDALHEAADAHLRIALVHHPLADLRDVDRERLETLLAAGQIHFLLRGHLHRNRTTASTTPDGTLIELAAGAV